MSTVREALIALELRGYVELRVGSGAYAALPATGNSSSGAEADVFSEIEPSVASEAGPFELLETRMLVEPECAALAARNASVEQIRAIEQMHRRMTSEHSNALIGLAAQRGFHEAVAAASGNLALASVVSHIWDLADSSLICHRLSRHLNGKLARNVAVLEQGRVLSAIVNQNPIEAHHATEVHLLGVIVRLSEDMFERCASPELRFTH